MKNSRKENFVKSTVRPFLRSLWSLTNRDLKKWYLAPVILIISLIQPVVWLGLFGKAFNFGSLFTGSAFNIPGLNLPQSVINTIGNTMLMNTFGTTSYFSFLAIGMLAFIVLFTSMFSGMSVVWDRRFGFLDKLLTTPVSRGSIVMGKILNSVIRALVQAGVVLIIAILLGMSLSYLSAGGIAITFGALFLLAFGMSSLFVLLALKSTDWQTVTAIANLLNLPLLFTSNAFFPIAAMPSWLQVIANVNPVSYAIDIGRSSMLGVASSMSITFEFAYLGAFAVVMAAISIVLSWKLLKG
ncbi:MAG: ABC transporter permease [Candidatus Parvarchaeota archaeon]|jgi:ABC-2 type transport system permease protein|nr:ABC transporter permease [Candidatus Parvarchaeota archaeon]MCL5101671.1 ABC transporter permease [Candidatus Parvarchaeota archaeon]